MTDRRITIRAARVNSSLTQLELAKAINVDRSTVINWENGVSYPTIDKAIQMCTVLNQELDSIKWVQ